MVPYSHQQGAGIRPALRTPQEPPEAESGDRKPSSSDVSFVGSGSLVGYGQAHSIHGTYPGGIATKTHPTYTHCGSGYDVPGSTVQQQQSMSVDYGSTASSPQHSPTRLVCSKMHVFDGSIKPASMRRQAEYRPPGPAPATTRSSHESELLPWAFVAVELNASTSWAHRSVAVAQRMADLKARTMGQLKGI